MQMELKTLWNEKNVHAVSGNSEAKKMLRFLRLTWRTEQDDFVLDLRNLMDFLENRRNSKRGVSQAAARIFNLIIFLSPFTT